jgi:zinc protease
MTLGSSFSTAVEGDFSIITMTCLSEHLEETLEILAGILRKPLFSALRIDHIKRFMEYQQKNEEDHPVRLMEREYFNAFFGDEGYGGSIFGTAEPGSLKTIKKKDILHFYKTFFNRANMVIVVSSDLNRPGIEEMIKKRFQPLAAGEKRVQLPPLEIPGTEKKEYFFKKEKEQTLISLGTLLPGMSARNFTRAYMLENLLWDGIGSKLWPLRAEKNLAYDLDAGVTCMKDAGMLKVYLRTDNAKKEQAFKALEEVMKDLYQKGVTGEELQTVKVRAGAQFLRSNETKERRTFYLGLFECIGPGFHFLEDFFSHIKEVTLEDFNGYIKEVLKPDRLVTVIIGPGDLPLPRGER